MDPLPLLNFFTHHASDQAMLGPDVWPMKEESHPPRSLDVTDAFAAAIDTLATICVSNEAGQKVAMTVTLPPDGRVIITLAENRCGVENTPKFLEQLWRALDSLRRNPSDKVEKGNDIFAITFSHGIHTLKRRIRSLWMGAITFHGFLEASKTKSGDESIRGRLTAAFTLLAKIVNRRDAPNRDEMVYLVEEMHAFYDHCQALLNERDTVRQWLKEYAACNGSADFPLRWYLMACLALYLNTASLIKLATHPDFDDIFRRPLYVKTLQPDNHTLDYPLQKSFWDSYIADILDRCEIRAAKSPKLWRALDEEITHAIATAKETKSAPVHCELRLLSHHHQSLLSPPEKEVGEDTATPPQNYIGTSEAPCYACGVFMDAYRSEPRDVFNRMYTRNPKPKLQVPWAMPKFGNATKAKRRGGAVRKEGGPAIATAAAAAAAALWPPAPPAAAPSPQMPHRPLLRGSPPSRFLLSRRAWAFASHSLASALPASLRGWSVLPARPAPMQASGGDVFGERWTRSGRTH
ncbi:hypothetical protein BD410DRAFT_846398 [Rickenella mellea]|uniref:Uncharacterized protein n=1 Tax=Rickenella mellea TaxID=50990 RepID=A0A4Y7PG81_9AGAM|nr:hypothetical protein BD410DRAFT_846398 [Rickenella mellea]